MTLFDAWPKVAHVGNIKTKLVTQNSKQFIGGAEYCCLYAT